MHTDVRFFSIFRTELLNRYERGSTLAGVIYVHRISDYRFTGISGRNFRMFRELCGESTLKNVVLVTNMWGDVSSEIGEAREDELSSKFFKPVLDKHARMVRHHNTTQSSHDIIRKIMTNHPEVLQIQRELVDEDKDIVDTAAGEAVNQELSEQIKRHRVELEKLQQEMAQALMKKDDETRQELDEERRKLQEMIEKTQKDSEEMAEKYAAEKEEMETKMIEMEKKIKSLSDLPGGTMITTPIYE